MIKTIEMAVDSALFRIAGFPPVSVRATLPLGEQLRRALMALSRTEDGNNTVSLVFTGKNPDGSPWKKSHEHAFFLPEDADGDGFIDQFVVHAKTGFDTLALHAVRSFRYLKCYRMPDISVTHIAVGAAGDLGGPGAGTSPLLQESRIWCSATPYFLTRYPKRYRNGKKKRDADGRWIDGPESQIRRELALRRWPPPVDVRFFDFILVNRMVFTAADFVSFRWNGLPRPNLAGMFVKLVFEYGVRGPLALGYGCHFGLGLFRPVGYPSGKE